jgi:hypothetical protein
MKDLFKVESDDHKIGMVAILSIAVVLLTLTVQCSIRSGLREARNSGKTAEAVTRLIESGISPTCARYAIVGKGTRQSTHVYNQCTSTVVSEGEAE